MKPIKFHKKDGLIPNEEWLNQQIKQQLSLLKNGWHTFVFDKPQRNVDQNALLWMWMGCLSEDGSTPEEHYQNCCEVHLPHLCLYNSTGAFKRGQTSTLNTNEFAEFLNKIQADAAIEGIILPEPKDKHFDEFKNEYQRYIR